MAISLFEEDRFVVVPCVRYALCQPNAARRLSNFSRGYHYPRGSAFFGVFPEFIAAARESKINNSISEKLIQWRMKHTAATKLKCWVMKITPFHQILNIGCPKMANFLLNMILSLTIQW